MSVNKLKFGGKIEIQGVLTLPVFSADPSPAVAGDIYYNSTSSKVRYYNGSSWQEFSVGSISLTGQSLNDKNIIVGNASNQSAAVNTNAVGDIEIDSTNGAQIKTGAVTNSHINSAANISLSKLASLVASRVLISDSSGVISASTITSSELNNLSGVTSNIQTQLDGKLNTSGGTLSGNLNMGSNNITNLNDPVNAQDAATKTYVDNRIEGLSWKNAVRAATTGNITLSGLITVDGVSLADGDSVLVKNQTSASENGIYVASTGSWSRRSDANSWSELQQAALLVKEGTINAGSRWQCNIGAGGTLNVDPITFIEFAGSGTVSGSGTANHVAYWTGSSNLGSEAHLSPSRGGLGTDASGFNGVVKASSGTFSASLITDSDIDAYAGIDRSKIAPGFANHVIVNNVGGNLSSMAQLDVMRGGTGTSDRTLRDHLDNESINWQNRELKTSSGVTLVNWSNIEAVSLFNGIKLDNKIRIYYSESTLNANVSSPTDVTGIEAVDSSVIPAIKIDYTIIENTSGHVRVGRIMISTAGVSGSIVDEYTENALVGNTGGIVFSLTKTGVTVKVQYNNTHTINSASLRVLVTHFML